MCICLSGAHLHVTEPVAAVALAIVRTHTLLSVLIHSESRRPRERERIIMFPLLSRLPQLSLKRGSQSTCLLIHLKLGNNRGTPRHTSTQPPLSLHPCLPSVVPSSHHFFPHSPASNFYLWRCLPGKTHSASVSALVRSLCTCFASSLASPLSSTWVLQRELPPPPPLPPPTRTDDSLPNTPLPPPCSAAGHRKRKNAESEHFRLYTARGKALV